MRTLFERVFPEREIYIRSNGAVRYVTLTSGTQVIAACVVLVVVLWSAFLTVRTFATDTALASRDRAIIEVREAYDSRVDRLQDRYERLQAELDDSERRFDQVVNQLSGKHGQLENAAGVQVAIQGELEASRRRLREVTTQRDDALARLEELRFRSLELERRYADMEREAEQSLSSLTDVASTLDATASQRDTARVQVRDLAQEVDTLNDNIEDIRRHQAQVMAQIEEATKASIVELERILSKSGVDVDNLVQEIERTYTGEGGPFLPISYRPPEASLGFPLSEDAVSGLLGELQRVNSLRIAIEKMPLAKPLRTSYRFTSGFGPRRHPVTNRWSMHNGLDMAAPRGTPIYPPVDGVVTYAGVQRGYGKVVKVLHSLGYETVYAHMDAIQVSKGDRVQRATGLGTVGNTGRSTGNHLHYEVRRYGKPLNPRKFIEAGRDVF